MKSHCPQFQLNHSGLVLFLEEDHYVSQDFLYVLKLMQSQAVKLCPACKIFTVGNHLEPKVYENTKADHVSSDTYFSKFKTYFNLKTICDMI